MLKKLLKHEWAACWKFPTILISVLLIISVFAGLTFATPIWQSEMSGLDFLLILVWMLYYFAIIGVSIGVVLYLAIRFYKSMYTDEGYLTHTLPVTSHQLLWSKIIPIVIWNIIAIIGIFISLVIFGGMAVLFLNPDKEVGEIVLRSIEEIIHVFGVDKLLPFGGSLLALWATGSISGAMMLVASITIGQLVGKHKVLGAIGAYFAINTVVQILSLICMMPYMINIMGTMEYAASDNVFEILIPVYFLMSGVCVLLSVVLYFISEMIIRKKLNLD